MDSQRLHGKPGCTAVSISICIPTAHTIPDQKCLSEHSEQSMLHECPPVFISPTQHCSSPVIILRVRGGQFPQFKIQTNETLTRLFKTLTYFTETVHSSSGTRRNQLNFLSDEGHQDELRVRIIYAEVENAMHFQYIPFVSLSLFWTTCSIRMSYLIFAYKLLKSCRQTGRWYFNTQMRHQIWAIWRVNMDSVWMCVCLS